MLMQMRKEEKETQLEVFTKENSQLTDENKRLKLEAETMKSSLQAQTTQIENLKNDLNRLRLEYDKQNALIQSLSDKCVRPLIDELDYFIFVCFFWCDVVMKCSVATYRPRIRIFNLRTRGFGLKLICLNQFSHRSQHLTSSSNSNSRIGFCEYRMMLCVEKF